MIPVTDDSSGNRRYKISIEREQRADACKENKRKMRQNLPEGEQKI